MKNMTTPIDIFADKPKVTPEYMVAVMQAKIDHPDWQVQIENILNRWVDISPPLWNWVEFIYRIHPKHKIAAGWNPQGLTEDQVGVKEGWRLLTRKECTELQLTPVDYIQYFNDFQWIKCHTTEGCEDFCHRTKHPLPQEKKRVPLTMDDLPPVFWVKPSDAEAWQYPLSISDHVIILTNIVITYETLMDEGWVYSIDRKEVKPFWREE